jgi:hypothetical protein
MVDILGAMSDTSPVPQRARRKSGPGRRLAGIGLVGACLVCAGNAAPSRATAAGQVLVKNAAASPWRVFEQTQSLRVQALDSFAIPEDQGFGPGHSLLVTQAIVGGRSRLQWLLDRASSFSRRSSYALPSVADDVRAFGAHESRGVWAVYAGVAPTGILRGTWSRSKRTLIFDPVPELTVAPPGAPGLKTQKVTGFADCAGAPYVSINTKLFRRNDGVLRRGVARWALVYRAPPVGPHNSGLRGLTCTRHDGSPSLLVSTEGTGRMYRFNDLPSGVLTSPRPLVTHLEFSPIPAIRRLLAAEGVPAGQVLRRRSVLRGPDRSHLVAELRPALPERFRFQAIKPDHDARPLGPGVRLGPNDRAIPVW